MKAPFLVIAFIFCFLISARAQTNNTGADTTSVKTVIEKDGSSYNKAIIILKNREGEGEQEEYAWIRNKYPGSKPHKQSLNFYNKIPYDIIYITTAEGKEVTVYFDISNFYGKY